MAKFVLLSIVIILSFNFKSEGQTYSRIDYQRHGENSSELKTYDLQILSLFADSTCIYQYQTYLNKRYYKKRIIRSFEIEHGIWRMVNDTLII